MFNSIRKDKKRRDLVKRFEIQRLQNKALFQAISVLENKTPVKVTLMEYPPFFAKDMKKKIIFSENFSKSKDAQSAPSEFLDNSLQKNEEMQSVALQSAKNKISPIKLFWQEKALKFTPRNSSKNRVRNRCVESGRSRAVLRFCKLSRICLRNKASRGVISGVNKASW